MSKPPVFFLAFANDRGQQARYLRNLPEEARQLEAALSKARQSGLCELIIRHNVTAEEIFNTFQSDEYRDRIAVFHFAGHANGYQLLLESSSGASEAASAGGLAHLLGQQKGLQLVFLNACSTMAQSDGLLKAGIPIVISTTETIDDQVATRFAQCFYAGLGNGATLKRAYRVAEARIKISQTPKQPKQSSKRGITLETETDQAPPAWLWQIRVRSGSETVLQWNLPEAVDDPLFGLPALPPQDLPPSPFRHLHAFQRDHAAVFFGRGALIRTLYDRVTQSDAAPIILFCGQSGVGKSSVLAAGLLPRLQAHYQLISLRRGATQGLWPTLCRAFDTDEDKALAAWVAQEQQIGQPLLLVFDQLEEVFTRPHLEQPHELAQFMAGLQQLFGSFEQRPQGKLILSYRKEWSLEFETALLDQRLPYSRVFVEPLDQRGILEAISGPANTPRLQQHYGLSMETGLAETIAHDLSADPESPIAPVLQILLTRMWQQVCQDAQPQFDAALYQTLKRDGLLLNDFFDQQLQVLEQQTDCAEAVQSGLLLDVLTYCTTARGTANERSQNALLIQYGHQKTACEALVKRCEVGYLLVSSGIKSSNSQYYHRLCHDALAPLIRERFEESDRPGQRARRILESRAVEWQGEQSGPVLDATDLALVERGAQGMRVCTEDEQRLLTASRVQRRKQRRQRGLWRAMGVLAIGLILATTALTGWQWRVAEQQKTKAQSEQAKAEQQNRLSLARQLAAQAKIAFDTGTGEGLLHSSLLAIESLKQAHTTQGTLAMAQAEALLPYAVKTLPTKCPVIAVRFDPSGKWLATSEMRQLTDADGKELFSHTEMTPEGYRVKYPAIDPKCNRVRLWDPETGQIIKVFKQDKTVWALAFNPDSSIIAMKVSGFVLIYEIETGKILARIKHEAGSWSTNIIFSKNGDYFAQAENKMVHIFNTKTWQLMTRLEHKETVKYIEFSSDGKHLVTKEQQTPTSTSSGSWMAYVWDIETGQKRFQVYDESQGSDPTSHRKVVFEAKFNSDGSQLASLSKDGYVKFWEVPSGKELQKIQIMKDYNDLRDAVFDHSLSKVAAQALFDQVSISDIDNNNSPITIPVKGSIANVSITWFISKPDISKTDYILIIDSMRQTARIWRTNWGAKEIFRFADVLSIPYSSSSINQSDSKVSMLGSYLLANINKDEKVNIWKIKKNALKNLTEDQLVPLSINSNIPASGYVNYTENKLIVTNKTSDDVIGNISISDPIGEKYYLEINAESISLDRKFIVYTLNSLSNEEDILTKTAQVWNLNTGQLEASLLHNNHVLYTALNSRGSLLATRVKGKANNIVYIWDVKNKKQIFELQHPEKVKGIAFIPNSSQLITSSKDRIVRIWDVTSGKQITQLEDNDYFKLNHDSSTLLVGSDKEVRIIKTGSWTHGITIPLKVMMLKFSQNGARLAVVSEDKFLTIWNTQTGALIKKIPLNGRLMGMTMNRDGSLLLLRMLLPKPTLGEKFIFNAKGNRMFKKEIRILKSETGEEQLRTWIPAWSSILGFSQDGRYWLTRDKPDAPLKQHPWRTEDLIANLCTRLPRNFTQKEWNHYMGDTPYQISCENRPTP